MIYFIILSFFFLSSLFLEWKFNIRLYQSRKERVIIPLIFFLIGLAWDSLGVYLGHWYFDFKNLLGIRIGLLPLEEYFFFLIVPYATLTYYRVLKRQV